MPCRIRNKSVFPINIRKAISSCDVFGSIQSQKSGIRSHQGFRVCKHFLFVTEVAFPLIQIGHFPYRGNLLVMTKLPTKFGEPRQKHSLVNNWKLFLRLQVTVTLTSEVVT